MVKERKYRQLEKDLGPVLVEGEPILDCTTCQARVKRMGKQTERRATLAVTDRRVLIFSKKLGGYDVQDLAFGLLTGVDHKRGMLTGHVTLRAAGDSADLQ